MASVDRPIPRDARLISLLIAQKGIDDADDRVLHQLLDFAHRYTADVLTTAQTLADHASRPGPPRVEREDVEVALAMRKRYEFSEGPPRDYLANLAHGLNSIPLPTLSETFETIRLPPPHQRLTEVNFDIVLDQNVVLADADEEDESDESSETEESDDEVPTDDERKPRIGQGDADGDEEADGDGDDDEDMEEVGMDAAGSGAPPPSAGREIDDDYDV